MTTKEFVERLKRRTRRAHLSLSQEQVAALEEYVRLLARWNQKINLTALNVDPPDDQAVDRLIVEPLLAAQHLPENATTLLDVGSGSGSPAIPLTIARPASSLVMVESKTRKAVFLTEVVRHLQLPRARVESSRFEELLARPELHESFDVATVRAVRIEPRTLLSLQAFLKPSGLVALFRSGRSMPGDIPYPLRFAELIPLLDSPSSSLVVLQKDGFR